MVVCYLCGQNHTEYGHYRSEVTFAVYFICTNLLSILRNTGGNNMRHFYFRLVLGIVFLICMVYSFITVNISFVVMYLILGGAFVFSAYSIWKKEKNNRG